MESEEYISIERTVIEILGPVVGSGQRPKVLYVDVIVKVTGKNMYMNNTWEHDAKVTKHVVPAGEASCVFMY